MPWSIPRMRSEWVATSSCSQVSRASAEGASRPDPLDPLADLAYGEGGEADLVGVDLGEPGARVTAAALAELRDEVGVD
jgi:hypothetical protein